MAIHPKICKFVHELKDPESISALGGDNLVGLLRIDRDGTFCSFVPNIKSNEVNVTPLAEQSPLDQQFLPIFFRRDPDKGSFTVCLRDSNWESDEFLPGASTLSQVPQECHSHCNASAIANSTVVQALGGDQWVIVAALQVDGTFKIFFPAVANNMVKVARSDATISRSCKEIIATSFQMDAADCLRMKDGGVYPIYIQPIGNPVPGQFMAQAHDGVSNIKRAKLEKV